MKNRAIKAGKAKHTKSSTFSLQINVMVPLRGGHPSSTCRGYAGCGFGNAPVSKAFGRTLARLHQSDGPPSSPGVTGLGSNLLGLWHSSAFQQCTALGDTEPKENLLS